MFSCNKRRLFSVVIRVVSVLTQQKLSLLHLFHLHICLILLTVSTRGSCALELFSYVTESFYTANQWTNKIVPCWTDELFKEDFKISVLVCFLLELEHLFTVQPSSLYIIGIIEFINFLLKDIFEGCLKWKVLSLLTSFVTSVNPTHCKIN